MRNGSPGVATVTATRRSPSTAGMSQVGPVVTAPGSRSWRPIASATVSGAGQYGSGAGGGG
jgi:hypothetical protein